VKRLVLVAGQGRRFRDPLRKPIDRRPHDEHRHQCAEDHQGRKVHLQMRVAI